MFEEVTEILEKVTELANYKQTKLNKLTAQQELD